MVTEDPGSDGILYTTTAMDDLWENSVNIQRQNTRFSYSTFTYAKSTIIFTIPSAPPSWLTMDGLNELRGDALIAFARYWTSAVVVHRKYGMYVKYMELLDEPSTNDGTFVTPDNYVVLIQTVRCMLQLRGVQDIFIMGPGLPTVISRFQQVEPYISAFLGKDTLIDAWSIHALENSKDCDFYNSGTFAARRYMATNLLRNVYFMKWTIASIPIFVTKFATAATRYSFADFGPGAPEMNDYAIRLMDNLTAIMNSGCSIALAWSLFSQRDPKSIYRRDGSRRPQREAISYVNRTLPTSGTIYTPSPDPPRSDTMDQTLKSAVVSNNSFGIILSRAQLTDGLVGKMNIQLNNPAWTPSCAASTISIYCFPSMIDTSGVTYKLTFGNGHLRLDFTQLPYQCTIFVKGDVYDKMCSLNPPLSFASFNIPKVADLSAITSPKEGDIVYDIRSNTLKTWHSGVWASAGVPKLTDAA